MKKEMHIDSPPIDGKSRRKISLFNEIDKDGDGSITDTELIEWMSSKNLEIDLGDIAAILSFFNGEADGNTTLEEIETKGKNSDLSAGMMSLPTGINDKAMKRFLLKTGTKNEDGELFQKDQKSNARKSIKGSKVLEFQGKLI